MKIIALSVRVIRLPFRFSFKHSLASRNASDNVIVRARVEHEGLQFVGFGESIPRDYVTGEDAFSAAQVISETYFPRFSGRSFESFAQLEHALLSEFFQLELDRRQKGASWCALELALLDAFARASGLPLAQALGGVHIGNEQGITYGAVIPFAKKRAFHALLWFYKLFGFRTVKIKVGRDFEGDLERVAAARRILGDKVTLRADANCAWSAEEALRCAQRFRPFKIASYEQPVAADDLEGLARVARNIPEQVMADESLCSIAQARHLASEKICTAFNIRISKVGGILAAMEIAKIAGPRHRQTHGCTGGRKWHSQCSRALFRLHAREVRQLRRF